MLSFRRRALRVTAFLLSLLAGLLAPLALSGCGSGIGYGSVAPASAPDAAGVYLPNYTAFTAPYRVRWAPGSRITYRVSGARTNEIRRAAEAGLEEWNKALTGIDGLPIIVQAPKEEKPNLTVRFVRLGSLDGEVAGEAKPILYTDDTQTTITGATISLDAGEAYLGLSTVRNTALHEMGHVLGLRGHSDNRADVMYPAARNFATITTRDRNSILTEYSGPAGSLIGGE